MTNYLRPDEQATNSEIERAKKRDQTLKTGVKTVGALGGGALAASSGIASKIAPFLSDYLPVDLAVKGINKVSPQLGNFLQRGMKDGLNIKEGLNFIKENISASQPAKQNLNIIEQHSPELHKFIVAEIKKGKTPIQAGALAFNNKNFLSVINKIKNEHKSNWADIIESVYGKEGMAQQTTQSLAEEAMQPPGSLPTRPLSAEAQAGANLNLKETFGVTGNNDKWGSIAEAMKKVLNS